MRKPLDLTTGKMKYSSKINSSMLDFRNNSFPVASSAARKRHVALDCQVSSGPRISCALLDYVVSPAPGHRSTGTCL